MLRCRSLSPGAAKRRRRARSPASPAPALSGGKRGHTECWNGSDAEVPPPPAQSRRRLVERDAIAQHGMAQVRSRPCLGWGWDHDCGGESFDTCDMGEGLEGLGLLVDLSNALILATLIMAALGAAGAVLGSIFSGLPATRDTSFSTLSYALRGLGVGLAAGALLIAQTIWKARL